MRYRPHRATFYYGLHKINFYIDISFRWKYSLETLHNKPIYVFLVDDSHNNFDLFVL